MQLPDFLDDSELNELRARMGANELGSFRLLVNPYRFTVAELEQLIIGGIEVKYLDEVRPLADRTLSFKDRRVILHKRDAPVPPMSATLATPLPSFHFSNCPAVRELRRFGVGIHVVSAREDGQFQVNLVEGAQMTPSLQRLPVCEQCLTELAFDDFSAEMPRPLRVRAIAGFTVTRFFSKYQRALIADAWEHGPSAP